MTWNLYWQIHHRLCLAQVRWIWEAEWASAAWSLSLRVLSHKQTLFLFAVLAATQVPYWIWIDVYNLICFDHSWVIRSVRVICSDYLPSRPHVWQIWCMTCLICSMPGPVVLSFRFLWLLYIELEGRLFDSVQFMIYCTQFCFLEI